MEPLTVQGDLNSIEPLIDYVTTAAARARLNSRAIYCLRLAVDEIATNIVTYGYQDAGLTGELTVTAVFHPQRLIIHLDDNGTTYDPRQALPPNNLNHPPHKRPTGNLGIFLAMWGVDEFSYERLHNRNRSTFIMQRPTKQEADQ
jgi:anti-sigma regulatory factor (Ser/Thr protein kinase)